MSNNEVQSIITALGAGFGGSADEDGEKSPGDFNVEARFLEADRDDEWNGRHVLEYVTHTFQGPHCGRRVWPEVKMVDARS